MTRRPWGSGTIERTRDGRFRARFAFTQGRRDDIEGSPFASYEDAERALDALLAALNEAGAVVGGITLRKLADKCLRQRDIDGYRSVDSEWGLWSARWEAWERAGMPASTTTTGDVRAHLASMRSLRGKPLAKQTRSNALNLLRAVYAFGVENELVVENPCDGIKVKDHGSTIEKSTHLTLDEANALVAAATDPGVALAIGTGMRSGELRALLWEDVKDDHVIVRYGSPGKPPKNGKIRHVPILALARVALDLLPRTHVMVLPTVTGCFRGKGQVFEREAWKAWLKMTGLVRRVRPHDLRHTCATLLLTGAWGRAWTYEEVKEMLGHSSVKVTERYARATGTLAEKAAREMAAKEEPREESPNKARESDAAMMTKARDIIERRGSDSNRRVTVLQTQGRPRDPRCDGDLAGLLWAFVGAVAEGSPFAIARGLDLAEALESALAEQAVGSVRLG